MRHVNSRSILFEDQSCPHDDDISVPLTMVIYLMTFNAIKFYTDCMVLILIAGLHKCDPRLKTM